jgi:hypothetical protein
MGNWLRFTIGFRRRDVVLWLTLCSHMMVTFGFPLPAPSRTKPTDGVAYPCQSRPCGCLTSEQCWAGDCCCFTLEEKVAWAEANGVTPPDHVRPLVESRRTRPAPAKKKSCCSEAPPAPIPSTCCQSREPAVPACCGTAPACEAKPDEDRPNCAAKPNGCEKKSPPAAGSGVRWVAGVFAQKCRGDGPAGLFQLDPTLAPDVTPVVLPEPDRDSHLPPRSERPSSLTHRPPARPPRPC